jgi:gliding motility-associated-like protein
LNATSSSSDVSNCYGNSNGSITISGASGGSGSFQYSKDGGISWEGTGANYTFTSLVSGTYNVQMRDALNPGCALPLNSSLAISQPAILNAALSSVNVTNCNGNTNASISVSAPTGGSGAYEYSINGGINWDNSGSFAGLSAGTYNVQIRDAANQACVIVLQNTLNITEPEILTAAMTSANVTVCNGNNNGSIQVTSATGGSGTYQYSSNGGTTWTGSGTGNDFTNLSAGIYNVQIRDAANTACIIVLNDSVPLAQPAVLSAAVSSSNISDCKGNSTGSISITAASGGSGAYQYSDDGINWIGSGNSNDFTNLSAGIYNVNIRDAANTTCVVVLNGALPITEPAVLGATLTATNVSVCFGSTNGAINISAPSGGSGGYEYTINGGTSWTANGSFPALTAGNYDVRIRDAAHTACSIILNGGLAISQPGALNATLASTDVTLCNGQSNGNISITAPSGGSGNYEYTKDGGSNWTAINNFSNLSAGTYDVKMRDADNTSCIMALNTSLAVNQPGKLTASIGSSDVTGCTGNTNGTINITNATGGSGNYNYSKDNGSTWQGSGANYSFTALPVGTYNIQIRDGISTSCIIILNNSLTLVNSDSFTPPVISSQPVTQGPVCENSATPQFTVSATGTALTYQWREIVSAQGNGIPIPEGGFYSGTNTPVLTITDPPASFNGKAYDVVITGTCGSDTSSAPLLIVINSSAGGTLTGGEDICEGSDAGLLTLSGQNGNIINWESSSDSSAAVWDPITNATTTYDPGMLSATTYYRVVVKNGNCASHTSSVAIENVQQHPSQAQAGPDQAVCGSDAGLAAIPATTGKGTWHIIKGTGGSVIDTTAANSAFSGDQDSTYVLTWNVTNGVCAASVDTAIVTLKTAVTATISSDVLINLGTSTQLQSTGGSTYQWSPGTGLSDSTAQNPVAQPKSTTTYMLVVTDSAGCYDTLSVTVTIQGVIIPNTFSPNGDQVHDTWKIQNAENYPNANIEIFNRWGQVVCKLEGSSALATGWDGRHNGTELPVGTYFYILKLDNSTSLNGSITILK